MITVVGEALTTVRVNRADAERVLTDMVAVAQATGAVGVRS